MGAHLPDVAGLLVGTGGSTGKHVLHAGRGEVHDSRVPRAQPLELQIVATLRPYDVLTAHPRQVHQRTQDSGPHAVRVVLSATCHLNRRLDDLGVAQTLHKRRLGLRLGWQVGEGVRELGNGIRRRERVK